MVSQAESQLKAGDYAAAVKTVDAGMRMDAGNADLQAVLDRAKPKFEAAERSRRSGLSGTELLKEKGDDFYKKASFEVLYVVRWAILVDCYCPTALVPVVFATGAHGPKCENFERILFSS